MIARPIIVAPGQPTLGHVSFTPYATPREPERATRRAPAAPEDTAKGGRDALPGRLSITRRRR